MTLAAFIRQDGKAAWPGIPSSAYAISALSEVAVPIRAVRTNCVIHFIVMKHVRVHRAIQNCLWAQRRLGSAAQAD